MPKTNQDVTMREKGVSLDFGRSIFVYTFLANFGRFVFYVQSSRFRVNHMRCA